MKKLLSIAVFLASFTPACFAAIVTVEHENFFLKYDDIELHSFGTPNVGGNTIFYLPTNMHVDHGLPCSAGQSTCTETWTTSFAIEMKAGHTLKGFEVTEQGDYSRSPNRSIFQVPAEPTEEYGVRARFLSRDLRDPFTMNFDSLDYSFTETRAVYFESWESSASYETEFSDGMWLTLQNTLYITGMTGLTAGPPLTDSTIHKKFLGVRFDIESFKPAASAVPLPAAAWLFASGLLGLAGYRKFNKDV